MTLKKRDGILLAIAAVILVVLWLAPEESTKRVPDDETHHRFHEMVKQEGKKAAEKFCEGCHNPSNIPLPKDHPPKFRCLFCHKLAGQ